MKLREGLLVMADGSVFEGEVLGWGEGSRLSLATGEVVFNTVMSGYQEVLTDPSYAGQVVTFTYPHIGNYGASSLDDESRRPFCRGVVVRELTERPSNWRADEPLAAFFARHGLPAIVGVDTRRLTRLIRQEGSMAGAFGPVEGEGAFDEASLLEAARSEPSTEGRDLVREVTCAEPYSCGAGPFRVVAYDFGIKRHILHLLSKFASVTVVPATTPADSVLAMSPDGVFLSNGPGDPAAVAGAAEAVRDLLGKVPVFGICLGHQILALALGAKTYKLAFGHHGGNHPVRHIATGTVEVTSQNHNYAVAAGTFEGFSDLTHLNLNDGVVEGLSCRDLPAFSVQYHPEAGPGPHDARYLFDQFADLMRACGAKEAPAKGGLGREGPGKGAPGREGSTAPVGAAGSGLEEKVGSEALGGGREPRAGKDFEEGEGNAKA
jgi:carbamoyl-phosphate synthase small subunit